MEEFNPWREEWKNWIEVDFKKTLFCLKLSVVWPKPSKQNESVFPILIEERPGDVRMAWEEIQSRGIRWVKRVKEGISALRKIDSAVGGKAAAFLSVV